ncbi:hypothetical protein ACVMDO_006335 [Bradyrhizobium sp. USDA 4513]
MTGPFELGDHVTHDFDRFSFETAQMSGQHMFFSMQNRCSLPVYGCSPEIPVAKKLLAMTHG